ncbi:MAG: DUF418 domain-containing protein [Sphingomonas bacterium]
MMERVGSRIEAIDALRGLALLGILIVNLDTDFRVTFWEQFSPHYATTADSFARMAIGFLVEFKAITIFSMLFGVGLAIQTETLARRGSVPRLLVRRLLVLLAFGLVHLLLIWNGDILTEYAIAGLIALPFILAPPRLTLAASAAALLLFLALPSLPLSLPFPGPEWMAQHILEARQAYGHGSFAEVLRFRVAETPRIAVYLLFIFPRTVGLILFGAWTWKSGLIRNTEARARLLWSAGWTGLLLGLLLCWLDGVGPPAPLVLAPDIARVVDAFAPIVLAIGYCALALRYFGQAPTRLVAWVAPVGRMAFTNYIVQSIILGLLFYGYGFGLLGRVGVLAGVGISVAVFAAQAAASRWWLRRHFFGPLEWLWRTGMYGARQPWSRRERELAVTTT